MTITLRDHCRLMALKQAIRNDCNKCSNEGFLCDEHAAFIMHLKDCPEEIPAAEERYGITKEQEPQEEPPVDPRTYSSRAFLQALISGPKDVQIRKELEGGIFAIHLVFGTGFMWKQNVKKEDLDYLLETLPCGLDSDDDPADQAPPVKTQQPPARVIASHLRSSGLAPTANEADVDFILQEVKRYLDD